MSASLASVNIAAPTTAAWAGRKGVTGIDKRPVEGVVRLAELGVEGDHVLDTAVHGGIDQSVYAYAHEDASWWAASLSRTVRPGNFGENFTTAGIALNDCVIGERWSVLAFRALTLEPDLLPRLLDAPQLPHHLRDRAARRTPSTVDVSR